MLLICGFALLAVGCNDDPAAVSPNSNAVDGTMTVTPVGPSPGSTIELTFVGPLVESRGAFFELFDANGEWVAGLWTEKVVEEGVPSPGYELDQAAFGSLDFAVGGQLPDLLLLPPGLDGGEFVLCTYNSVPRTCANLTVVT